MAQLDKAALIAKIDSYFTTNGTGAITGAKLNELVRDLVDSLLNTTDDTDLLGTITYDPAKSYPVDTIAYYNGVMWIAIATATGSFDETKWVQLPRAKFIYSYTLWSGVTAYVVGNRVQWQHKVWECISNSTNDQPDVSPAKWQELYNEDETGTRTYKVQTTTTAWETVVTVPVEVGTAQYFTVSWMGRRNDGNSRAYVQRTALFYKNAGGALTQEGATSIKDVVRSDPDYYGDIVIESGLVAIKARGNTSAAETVDWVVTVVVNRVKP
jgi:hypothetical protein